MESLKNFFNPTVSNFVHLDINSCFATLEQQANPLLRHKPLVVTAYNGRNGCVLASSVQAKKLGIKTGMRLSQAQKIYPKVNVLTSDPNKYRFVHFQIKDLLSQYTPIVIPKSIDEFVMDFSNTFLQKNLLQISTEIKQRIKKEIGDYITVSVGVGPNTFLAKTASNLHKPDGLDEINSQNFLSIYKELKLTDLTGISTKTATRLNMVGIDTVLDLYDADLALLKKAFRSVLASYWYQKIRGYEAGSFSDLTKSIGHTYTLPRASANQREVLSVLSKLAEKVSIRLRRNNLVAHGFSLAVYYQDRSFYHKSLTTNVSLFHSMDIYRLSERVLNGFPGTPVRNLSLTCFSLSPLNLLQLDLFDSVSKKADLDICLDKIKSRWGSFAIFPASMANTKDHAPDAIGFGNIP